MDTEMRKIMSALVLILICVLTVGLASFCDTSAVFASDDEITVYFTISEDSDFVTGKDDDQTVLARVPMKISYVDMAKYGLERFYRYESEPFEKGGKYINNVIVERPTLLMLYIKALEKYYLKREATPEDMQSEAIEVGGVPTSGYLTKFWGHDENLMYYYNHAFPLMAPGWGATCDYILLEDGDEIDVGMYTDWSFYTRGKFIFFDETNPKVKVGEKIRIHMLSNGTSAAIDGSTVDAHKPISWEYIRVSEDKGRTWKKNVWQTDDEGGFDAVFSHPGIYYISSGPKYKLQGDTEPCYAPPISVVEVSPRAPEEYSLALTSRGRIRYTWEEAEGASLYEVEYRMQGESEWHMEETDKAEFFLTPGETGKYEFRVTAFMESDYVPEGDPVKLIRGETSDIVRIDAEKVKTQEEIDKEAAEAAEKLTVSGLKAVSKAKKFTVSWKKTEGATSYQVQYRLKGKKWGNLKASVKAVKAVSKKLKKGKSYQFRVRTITVINGEKVFGAWSAVKTAKCK